MRQTNRVEIRSKNEIMMNEVDVWIFKLIEFSLKMFHKLTF